MDKLMKQGGILSETSVQNSGASALYKAIAGDCWTIRASSRAAKSAADLYVNDYPACRASLSTRNRTSTLADEDFLLLPDARQQEEKRAADCVSLNVLTAD